MADKGNMSDFFAKENLGKDAQCEEHTAPLLKAIHSADICVLYQTPDLVYTQAENLPAPLQKNWHNHCSEDDLFSKAVAEQMKSLKQKVLEGGPTARLEVKLPQTKPEAPHNIKTKQLAEEILKEEARVAAEALEYSHKPESLAHFIELADKKKISDDSYDQMGQGQALWYKFSIEAHRNIMGDILGVVTTGVNISELRAREEVLKVLLREVSHRSKNLLAIIQSIAAQTARFSDDIEGFLRKFQGRLQSLASSQDLVTDSDWRGALLQDLILAQTNFYTDTIFDKEKCTILVEGENPYLFPSAALHIGLALHELVINSASYGALALNEGKITISCSQRNNSDEEDSLLLIWQEEFPVKTKPIPPFEAREAMSHNKFNNNIAAHFGSIVLEKIVPISVEGEATYNIENGNIKYSLDIPCSQYSYECIS